MPAAAGAALVGIIVTTALPQESPLPMITGAVKLHSIRLIGSCSDGFCGGSQPGTLSDRRSSEALTRDR